MLCFLLVFIAILYTYSIEYVTKMITNNEMECPSLPSAIDDEYME